MIRNLLLILIVAVGFQGCNSSDKGYSVTGSIENAEGMKIYLEDISSPQIVVLDTTKVVNGGFSFEGNAQEGLFRLRIIPTNESMIFYLPEKKAKVEISWNKNEPYEYTITGNEESVAVQKLNKEVVSMSADFNKLRNAIAAKSDSIGVLESEMESILVKMTNTLKAFISENENGYLKTYALTMMPKPNDDLEFIHETLTNVLAESPQNAFAQNVFDEVDKYIKQRDLQAAQGLGIGKEAPDITLPDVTGKPRKLSSLRGKVVLIDFWAAWCKPCRVENPNVVRVYNRYKDKGFEIFSVSLDKDKSAWTGAIREDGLYWENHVSDLKFWNSEVVALYNIKGIPQTFLIDAEGKIIAKNLRGQALENRLNEIFN